LGSVKDIKLLGREADFLAQYGLHNHGNSHVLQRQYFLQQIPRLWLELLAVTGLAAVVLIMIEQGKPSDALLPILGLFGAAAFRLIPSINRSMVAIQGARFALPVINTLHHELIQMAAPASISCGRELPLKITITLDHVGFHYPNVESPALSDINLQIPQGASVGFVGGSGAGKSTLIDVILGLLCPTSGRVMVDQVDIQSNLRGWQNQIGYVPQAIFLTDDTLRRNIAFGLPDDLIDEDAVHSAIRYAQLEDFVNTLPLHLETVVGERGVRLSGGQRQRIGIARALYHNPSILVLDEATSSLDTATEQGIMDAIKAMQGEKTIIIVAHRLSTVEHCDRLIRLAHGRLVEEKTPPRLAVSAPSNLH
jgi:ABC-type multidrug transport system fused ATPase/permease subunit